MTADLFDRLQTIKDRCDAHLEKAAKAAKKLETEMANLETELLLADALAALRLVSTRNMSEGQRNQIAGLKKRITQALEKAA